MANLRSTHIAGDLSVAGNLKANLVITIAGVAKSLSGVRNLTWTAEDLGLVIANTKELLKTGTNELTTASAVRGYVGEFGLGGAAPLENNDLWIGGRIKGWNSSNTDGPTTGVHVGLDLGYAADRRAQLAIDFSSRGFIRGTASAISGRTGWVELLTKNNINTTQSGTAEALSSASSRTYQVQRDANDKLVVNVPWEDTNTVYTHPTTDGNKHVPATGTSNNGKFLMAGATAGSLSWTDLPAASATVSGVVTTAAQTFAGDKTFSRLIASKTGQTNYTTSAIDARSTAGDVFISLLASGASAAVLQHVRGGNGILIKDSANALADVGCRTLTASSDVVLSSDKRKKMLFEELTDGYNKLDDISSYTYVLRKDKERTRRAGIIAQQLQAVLPEATSIDKDGYLAISPTGAIAFLISALKGAKNEIETLKEELSLLKEKLS